MSAKGSVTAITGGQWGSEGKGAIAAYITSRERARFYDLAVTNAGAQAGHTFVDEKSGEKHVVYHLPVATAVTRGRTPAYLTAGAIIDIDTLFMEIEHYGITLDQISIHPRAAVISKDCMEEEMNEFSVATAIASTQKGVGAALARKVQRNLNLAENYPELDKMVKKVDLNHILSNGSQIFMEIPQGFDLSINHGSHYPNCTSRDCWVTSALSDAGIHPFFLGHQSMVIRTFPIRVGHINKGHKQLGHSGGYYLDQEETTFSDIGVEDEYTTVTQRRRRIFTFSAHQYYRSLSMNMPDRVFLTFCNYCSAKQLGDILSKIRGVHQELLIFPDVCLQNGPTNDDVYMMINKFGQTRHDSQYPKEEEIDEM